MLIVPGRVEYTPTIVPGKVTLAWDEALMMAYYLIIKAISDNAGLVQYPTKIKWIKELRAVMMASGIQVEIRDPESGIDVPQEPGLKISKDLIDHAMNLVQRAHGIDK
jgi:hypothetical protein